MNCYFRYDDERQEEYGRNIGRMRLADAVANGRSHVGHLDGDDKENSYVRGAWLEFAFYLWLGGKRRAKWNAYFPNATHEQLRRADIERATYSIDVKARPRRWNEFLVRCDQVSDNHVYVLACDRYFPPIITFRGWITGEALRRKQIGGRPEIPGYVVQWDDSDLRDCIEFQD
jgi:hypothetical protein